MDFFRKKKGESKSKKQGKKDKTENSSSSPAFGLNVKGKNESKQKGSKSHRETNVDGNISVQIGLGATPPGYVESPSLEVESLAKMPEPDNEVVIVNNRILSSNGVQAYKQFNDVLHKMDKALLTEESEDDMDASSLGLALRSEPDIDMSPSKTSHASNNHQNVVDPAVHVPVIHVTQPSIDSTDEDANAKICDAKSPLEWNSEDVVNWCKSRGLTYFAELFEGCDVDGATVLDMTEEDLLELGMDDVEEREQFLKEVALVRESMPEGAMAAATEEDAQETEVEIDHPLAKWTNEDILIWLEEAGLTRFLTVFRDYEVTGLQLMDLDLQMLDDLGITQIEDREEFLSRFYELLNNDSLATPVESQATPQPYDPVNPTYEGMTVAIEDNDLAIHRHNNTPAEELDDDSAPTPVPTIDVPSPEPDEKIEEIWSSIESGKSPSEHHSTSDQSTEVTPRSTDYESTLLSPEVDIDKEIKRMEKTIAELQSDLQGSEDTESEEHSAIILKLSNAQSRLRSLHQQKSVMEDSSDDSKSQEATFEIHTSDLYHLMAERPAELVTVEIGPMSDEVPGFDVLEDSDYGGLVITSCLSEVSLMPGDRLLEINGYNISSTPLSVFEQFMSTHPPPLKLVVIRPTPGKDEKDEELTDLKDDLTLVLRDLEAAMADNKELKNESQRYKSDLKVLEEEKSEHAMQIKILQEQVEASEARWKDLRKTLVKMKNDQFDLETAFGPFSQWKPQMGTKDDLDEALQTVNVLQKTLEEKHVALSSTAKEKDEYKRRLNQILNDTTCSDLDYDMLDEKRPIWESLQSRSKAEVLQALKDNILENERQKICFDQLVSVVMKRAPMLLQQVDVLNAIKFEDVKNRPEHQC